MRLLFASNGIGEDAIATTVLDALMPRLPHGASVTAWPMVGTGRAYADRDIAIEGPLNRLPSEGFGTLEAGSFAKDLKAGFLGLLRRQITHGLSLRGRFDYVFGVGDIIPLAAIWLSRAPAGFIACAKSSYYSDPAGRSGGHGWHERWIMRRSCQDVFARDSLTARGLARQGIAARDFGNPMMDGLEVPAGANLLQPGETGVAVLPGSRQDATDNCLFLLQSFHVFDRFNTPSPPVFLFAVTAASDLGAIRARAEGWQAIERPDGLDLVAPNGTRAVLLRGQFARILSESTLAVGLAGTANEQAIGKGLPLITTHGSGNQGKAFLRMKMRYFGPSALPVDREPRLLAHAVSELLSDPARRAAMAEAGRARMGPPGASAKISTQILARLEEIS
jgi:uncharacterized protein (TIGR03492 family)